jgi:hypothetical protein
MTQRPARPGRARSSRPNSSQRGYDTAWQRTRKAWEARVKTGTVACWRCGGLITATDQWDLGHDDRDRSIIRGPEHAACNRATMSHRPPRRRPVEPHPGATTPGGGPQRDSAERPLA